MEAGALLVIDVQKAYIKRYEDGLLERINQRIEKAVADGETIIYIKNIRALCLKEKKSPLATGLYIASSHVFTKKKANAFSNIELVKFLKENGITKIEIVGVDGNCCVFHTAKEAGKCAPNVIVNCDCVGVMNNLRFEKKKKSLSKLGVDIQ